MYPHVLVTLISATGHDLFNMFCFCLAFAYHNAATLYA